MFVCFGTILTSILKSFDIRLIFEKVRQYASDRRRFFSGADKLEEQHHNSQRAHTVLAFFALAAL
jgi:hypothetical protein